MIVKTTNFNEAEKVTTTVYKMQADELHAALTKMSLHLKASDQEGKQGTAIFDPVGTNFAIKAGLQSAGGWHPNVAMPSQFNFLGTDVDFVKAGVLVEAQFSNYPFLLNNLMRSELLYKSKVSMAGQPIGCVVIVTKAHIFPASNSTLYYEQAVNQVTALAKNNVFSVPIQIVGLFENFPIKATVKFTGYASARYSREIVTQVDMVCDIGHGRGADSRCVIRMPQASNNAG